MKRNRKLTSINMKVSNRLHNQRTALAEQTLQMGALLNQRPLPNNRNSIHILKNFVNNSRGMLELPWHCVFSVRRDLSSVGPFVSLRSDCSCRFAVKHNLRLSGLIDCLHGQVHSDFPFMGETMFQPPPGFHNCFIGIWTGASPLGTWKTWRPLLCHTRLELRWMLVRGDRGGTT
jgi:hypothetical protein